MMTEGKVKEEGSERDRDRYIQMRYITYKDESNRDCLRSCQGLQLVVLKSQQHIHLWAL